jgi:hypothetical protein
MIWKNQERPRCHERVLCVKQHIDESGLTDPQYDFDEGFVNAFGEFVWKGGGIVMKWIELPPIEDL